MQLLDVQKQLEDTGEAIQRTTAEIVKHPTYPSLVANLRSLEKRFIHWRCNWLISRCQRLSLAVGAPVLEDEKNFRFSQVRRAPKAFGELPPGGSLQARPERGSASGYG